MAGVPISQIPPGLATLASGVAAGGRAITRSFVDRWQDPVESALTAYIPSATCQFRLLFSRTDEHKILWIPFGKKTQVVFDATVSFQLNSISDLSMQEGSVDVGALSAAVVAPSFLVTRPSRADLDRFGFGADSTAANTILLRLGPDRAHILAVMNPETRKKARIRYSPNGIPGEEQPKKNKYSLDWVLAFVRTLGAWIESDTMTEAAREPFSVADENTVPGVLFYLLQAYSACYSKVASPSPEAMLLPAIFQKRFVIEGYGADVKLRLAADGTLSDGKDFESSQLTLRLRVRRTAAEITAIPNELSTADRLTASFVAALEFNVDENDWADRLNVSRVFVRPFFQTAQDQAAVLRIARDNHADTDVVILTGMLAGMRRTVMLSARFTVNMKKDPPDVDVTPDSIEVLAIAPENGAGVVVGLDAVDFLLKYLVNLRHWMGVLS